MRLNTLPLTIKGPDTIRLEFIFSRIGYQLTMTRGMAAYLTSLKRLILGAGLAAVLSSCTHDAYRYARDTAPIPKATLAIMSEKGMEPAAPILMRSFKKESEIEIWKVASNGKYALLKTYPMCRWSGQLGPKMREGDRQAPEGFYDVTASAMNPNSSLFLSFNIGYPNAFDRAHGRSGSHLMVHGACSSQGCFAMTDEAISEVYAIAREAFAAGQSAFQFQSYPFRMTAENLAKHRGDDHFAFWKNLKKGSDMFEVSGQPPTWRVANRRYAFDSDPAFAADIVARSARDERDVVVQINKGVAAIRLVYEDGGGHPSLKKLALAAAKNLGSSDVDERTRRSLGDISRPAALGSEPREIPIESNPAPSARGQSKPIQNEPAAPTIDRATSGRAAAPAPPPSSEPDANSSFSDRSRSSFPK